MKKILIIYILMLNIWAGCIQNSTADITNASSTTNCLNAFDVPTIMEMMNPPKSISTKVAGDTFGLRITNKCIGLSNITYSLIDNETGSVIATSTSLFSKTFMGYSPIDIATFNVADAHKDVSVKFEYDKREYNITPTSCPMSSFWSGWMKIASSKLKQRDFNLSDGVYMIYTPTFMPPFKKCYKVSVTTYTYTEYSTDNFAIRPDKFDISLNKTGAKVGELVPMSIVVQNKVGNKVLDYEKKSVDMSVEANPTDAKLQYSFDIVDGEAINSKLYFAKEGSGIKIAVSERVGDEFAVVDSDDTIDSCRIVSGESNSINIVGSSKYWAGAGTGESENDPSSKSVDTEIVQNTKKDIHFQKMNW